MTITYAPLSGGLRSMHADLVAAEEPVDALVTRLVVHNQELIDRTFTTRHLVNQFANAWVPWSLGIPWALVAAWGRFRSMGAGTSVVVRVCLDENVDDITYYACTTPYLPARQWEDADGNEWLVDSLGGTAQIDSTTVLGSTALDWAPDLVVEPPPGARFWYLSLWATCAEATWDFPLVHAVSAIEGRKVLV